MSIVDAIILGLLQGITGFLPISSTGHLIITREFLTIDVQSALAFDGTLHLATTLALIIYFRSDILTLIQSALRKLSRLPVNEKDLTLFYALCVGTIPAVIIGLLVKPFFNKDTQSASLVAVLLLLSAVLLMYAEWRYYQRSNHRTISVKRGLQIGLFQVLAIVPGFSRLGATMAGGMLMGMSRIEAARFAFLIGIPVTAEVGSMKLLESLRGTGMVDWLPITIGCVVALVTALLVIHFFLSFIKKYTLWPFIWYGVVLACLVGYLSSIM